MPSGNALKRDAGGKKGELLCCKRIFDRIEGNLAEIQPKNHRNVQKTRFLQKVPGVNGLIYLFKANKCWVLKFYKKAFLQDDLYIINVHHMKYLPLWSQIQVHKMQALFREKKFKKMFL